ncbi:MAG: PAS domain S-box protein [Candidatus Lokiarchaeota archaeon]|nr:PAS domain S-box protein [Candidatus Lokiarchaeota archaeon]
MMRVLQVDDDEMTLFISLKHLEKNIPGIDLIQIKTAKEALEKLESAQFDAIICDYQMPGMDGLELLDIIRKKRVTIPFIIFTGKGREEVAINALNLGADYYVEKRGDAKSQYAELAHVLKRVIAHHKSKTMLEQERKRTQKYLDVAGVILLALDTKGNVTMINQKGCEILELTKEEIIGKNWFSEFLPKGQQDEIFKIFKDIMNGRISEHEYEEGGLISRGGVVKTIAWNNTLLYDDEGNVIGTLSSGMDVTEIKKTEFRLKRALAKVENHRQYQELLFEAARSVLTNMVFDNASKEVFEVCKTLTGARSGFIALLSEDGTTNDNILIDGGGEECKVDPELPTIIRGLRKVAYQECRSVYDNSYMESKWTKYMPEGHVALYNVLLVPLIIRDEAVGLIGLANKPEPFTEDDVKTVEVLAEIASVSLETDKNREALKESEERFHTFFSNAPFPAAVLNEEGRFLLCNQELERFLGYSQEEFREFSFINITHPEDIAIDQALFEEVQKGERDSYVIDKRYIRKNGEIIWGRLGTSVVRDGSGGLKYVFGIISRTGERKPPPATKKEMVQEVSELVHSVSHDLRGSISNIAGLATLFQEEQDSKYIEKLVHITKNMQDLLNRFVELIDAGLVTESLEHINLNELVDNLAQDIIPDHINFRRENLPNVIGDPVRVEQLFRNLFVNAVEHGNPTSIRVYSKSHDDGFAIFVSNNGDPIPIEYAKKIFSRGFTTKEHGTGIGLTIVQRVAEAHNWQINLESVDEPTFRIFIPMR